MELIIQTFHPVLALTWKYSYSEKAVILSKIIFLFKKAGAHLQYVYNNLAKFQIDFIQNCWRIGGVDYTNFLDGTDGRTDRRSDAQTDRG